MMFDLHPTFLGYLLLILGLGLMLLLALVLRWLPRLHTTNSSTISQPIQGAEFPESFPAVLHIQPGGKVAFINQGAKDLFRLHRQSLSLENLARCTQPRSAFLSLCAKEGQATFSLNGRLAEGISIPAPARLAEHQKPGLLISISQPSLHSGQVIQPAEPPRRDQVNHPQKRTPPSAHTLSKLAEISQTITGNLDLGKTIQAILESCTLLVPADFMELTVWENPAQPPQSFCLPGKADKRLSIQPSPHRFSIGHGLAAWLVAKREPLVMDYISDSSEIRPDLKHTRYPYRSYLGYPIVDGRSLIGLLEFASLEENNYTQEDIQTLHFFSGQIAIALQHAFLFRSEHRKALELSGLADLTQAINAIREPQDLFYRLVESISPLLDVQVLGFIVLNETRRMLTAQIPFKGVHSPSIVEWYQFVIQPGSPAEEIWQSAESILASEAMEDNHFKAFELDHFARMVGIHGCILTPLTTSGQMVGYLLAGNKLNGENFDQDDVRFLNIISGKAAPIIANANLVRLSRQRAQRAEVLRRIASLAKSNATFDETLKFSTLDLARLLQADIATVFLLDPQGQELKLHQESAFGVPPQAYPNLGRIYTHSDDFSETACHSQKLVMTGNLDKLDPVPRLYHPFQKDLQIQSLVAIPILFNQQGIGELVLASQRSNLFSNHDVQTAVTACELMMTGYDPGEQRKHETSNNLESAQTAPFQTQSNDSLKTEQQKFAALKREQRKTETLLQIFTELSTSLDLKHVLHATLKVLGDYSGAQEISIWVNQNENSEIHPLAKVSQPALPPQADAFNPTSLERALATAAIKQAEPLLIEDILQEPDWLSHFSEPRNGQVYRSILGAPLVNGAEILGCLLLLHPDRAYFSFEQVDLVQAVAYQVSMAINHANLFRLIHDQAEDFGVLLRNQQIETSRTKALLEAVADGVLVTDASRKISLFNHSAEEILGLHSSKVLGKSIEHFLGLFGGSAPKWIQTIEQWTTQPSSYQPGETFSQQIHLDDDRIISVRLTPVFLSRDFLGTVSIFQDITHQVELDRLKSEFVATVSHELRTPMTSIKGYVDILLMGAAGKLSDQQGHFLDIIKSNADRLSILVNDLLDISRIEVGRNVLTLQPLNLEEIIDQVCEHYRQLAQGENKSTRFTKDLPSDLPRVVGDYERVRQILNNIVDNAYRYNIESGSVCVHAFAKNGEVQVEVQDTGVGIPSHEISKVFERFFRGETPLQLGVSGTGLGLSIVKNLVEMHQGQIWIESSGVSGEGSRVSFTLPAYNPQTKE